MKKIQYSIGNYSFVSKKAIEDQCKKILYSVERGSPLVGADADFVGNLLLRHRDAAEKIGPGVQHFEVREWGSGGFASVCFWIVRIDGSETDFSYRRCIYQQDHAADVCKAGRLEIADQVIGFKKKNFKLGDVHCSVTGVKLTPDDAHVDHEPPLTFAAIWKAWLNHSSNDPLNIKPSGGDAVAGELFADRKIAEDWQSFHLAHAKLRIVSRGANLSTIPVLSRAG